MVLCQFHNKLMNVNFNFVFDTKEKIIIKLIFVTEKYL